MPRKHIEAFNLSEAVFETMLSRKQADGFGADDWGPWFTYLAQTWKRTPSDADRRRLETGQGLMTLWLGNFGDNLQAIREGHTIRELVPEKPPERPAIIVGRGPSLFKHADKQMPLIYEHREKVVVVSTDGASKTLLEHGITPDFVMSLDGNRELIRPFYEGKNWDSCWRGDESTIKVVLTINVAHNVYQRVQDRAKVYWCSSMWDDYRIPDSLVRWISMITMSKQNPNGVPS